MKNAYLFGFLLLGIYSCGSDDVTPEEKKPVTASLSASLTKANTGEEITFTSVENTNVVSWHWTFEGGTPATSTEQNPKVTYSNSGTYDVQLIVKSNNDADTLKKSDFIVMLPGSGLMSFYKLDNAAGTDAVGGHHATMSGATAVADRNGNANSAVKMADNGTISFHNFDINSDYTYSFWYKKENTGNAWDRFMAKRSDCGNSKFIEMYANTTATNYSINLEYNTGTGSVFMSGIMADYNTWVHIAVVYLNKQFKVYVNGNPIATSATLSSPDFTNTSKLGFANTACYGTEPSATRIKGASLDNFRFYSKGLSDADIKILYQHD